MRSANYLGAEDVTQSRQVSYPASQLAVAWSEQIICGPNYGAPMKC